VNNFQLITKLIWTIERRAVAFFSVTWQRLKCTELLWPTTHYIMSVITSTSMLLFDVVQRNLLS